MLATKITLRLVLIDRYLNANFTGKLSKTETEHRSERLNDADVDGRIWPRRNRFRFNQPSSTRHVQLAKLVVQNFRQIDLVVAETRLEKDEDVVDLSDSQELDDDHGAEENEHFPDAHKDVGEVTGRFHLFLDLAEVFDETYKQKKRPLFISAPKTTSSNSTDR